MTGKSQEFLHDDLLFNIAPQALIGRLAGRLRVQPINNRFPRQQRSRSQLLLADFVLSLRNSGGLSFDRRQLSWVSRIYELRNVCEVLVCDGKRSLGEYRDGGVGVEAGFG